MPLIGGSEGDFTSALEAVDSELAKNSETWKHQKPSWVKRLRQRCSDSFHLTKCVDRCPP